MGVRWLYCIARGCPCPSPDARYGHPALRSLDAGCASASCLRWPATPALGHGQPRASCSCLRSTGFQPVRVPCGCSQLQSCIQQAPGTSEGITVGITMRTCAIPARIRPWGRVDFFGEAAASTPSATAATWRRRRRSWSRPRHPADQSDACRDLRMRASWVASGNPSARAVATIRRSAGS
jgi:hypothetical protein